MVWSRAPGQIFLRSGTWGLPVFQQRSYVGKTRGINSILYEGYGNVLFNIIVISYLSAIFLGYSPVHVGIFPSYSTGTAVGTVLSLFVVFLYCQQ